MENIALTESTYYILLSLYHPQHGYGIMQQTEQLSGGRVHLAAGTLYGALNSLVEAGYEPEMAYFAFALLIVMAIAWGKFLSHALHPADCKRFHFLL